MPLTKHTEFGNNNTRRELLKILHNVGNPIMYAEEENYGVVDSVNLIHLKKEITKEIQYAEHLSISELLTYFDDLTKVRHYRERDALLRSLGLPTFDSIASRILMLGRYVPYTTSPHITVTSKQPQ
jgi:hypothetical protein